MGTPPRINPPKKNGPKSVSGVSSGGSLGSARATISNPSEKGGGGGAQVQRYPIAGGVLEYGPLQLESTTGKVSSPLLLGGFARWSVSG